MPTSVIEHIRRVVGDGLRDGELLGRYVDRRDEAALAALVNRHGPMVWGVCRRQLSHHDAEDAFQATFIVLVRKASSIAQREAVGNWLYGVAHQTALQARRAAARRREVQEMPDVEAPQDLWADVRPVLDEELSRLPDHYRTVIVLCDLEGITRKEVAAQLGCPEGTVASRLVRARAMLAKRLTQRGLALSGGALAMVLSQSTGSAGVPAAVLFSTIKAVSLFAAGQAVITSKVAALAEGVLKTMLVSKLKAAVAVVLVLGFLAIGAIGVNIARGDAPQVSEPKDQKVVNKEAGMEETIAWGKEVDGLQAGLAQVPAVARGYRPGEKVNLEVRLRNVGKADVMISYGPLRGFPPEVTDAKGADVFVTMPPRLGLVVILTEHVLKAGETITLYNPQVAVEALNLGPQTGAAALVRPPTICVAPGKYKIAFGGMLTSHPKLTTGSVEFEVKPARVTAWGEEVDGVQVGIQFDADRAYTVGETVTLIVRLRNNGKKDVPLISDEEYFQKNPPLITDADGKAIKIKERNIFGLIEKSSVAPGKEVELCRLGLELRPGRGSKERGIVDPVRNRKVPHPVQGRSGCG